MKVAEVVQQDQGFDVKNETNTVDSVIQQTEQAKAVDDNDKETESSFKLNFDNDDDEDGTIICDIEQESSC